MGGIISPRSTPPTPAPPAPAPEPAAPQQVSDSAQRAAASARARRTARPLMSGSPLGVGQMNSNMQTTLGPGMRSR